MTEGKPRLLQYLLVPDEGTQNLCAIYANSRIILKVRGKVSASFHSFDVMQNSRWGLNA